MAYYLGYRWFDNQKKTPLYAFGHGLSYTSFDYSNLQVPCSTVTKGMPSSKCRVDVKNTGTVDGDETVLLFNLLAMLGGSDSGWRLQGAQGLPTRHDPCWNGRAHHDSDSVV